MGGGGVYTVSARDIARHYRPDICQLSRAEKDRLERLVRIKGARTEEERVEFLFPFETFYDIGNNFFFSGERAGERGKKMIFERREELVEIANLRIWNFRIDSRGLLSLARRVIPMTSLCGKR